MNASRYDVTAERDDDSPRFDLIGHNGALLGTVYKFRVPTDRQFECCVDFVIEKTVGAPWRLICDGRVVAQTTSQYKVGHGDKVRIYFSESRDTAPNELDSSWMYVDRVN